MKPIVITGFGAVHPHGFERAPFSPELTAPPSAPAVTDFKYKRWFPESSKRIKKMDMVGKFASCAATFALQDAGCEAPPAPSRTGLVTGTMFGGFEACVAFHTDLVERGPDSINPVHFPNTSHNVPCGHVAITLGLHGPMTALVSGMAAGHQAILTAARTLASGRADMMFAGGFDRWIPELAQASAGLGLTPAEGAGFLVLETEEAAARRGAKVLGRILGWGQASDLGNGLDPEGRGLAEALRRAQKHAGVERPSAVVLGTNGNSGYDASVQAGYRTALGADVKDLPRFEPKAVLGETMAAAGPLGVAAALVRANAGSLPSGPLFVDGYAWGGAAAVLVVEGAVA